MEYQVPQFIEVENKVIGPLTLKQFIYSAGAVGLCVIFFVYLPIYLAILFSIPVGGLGVALAFYKMNGKPFSDVLEAGFRYYTGSKLFLWKHEEPKEMPKKAAAQAEPEPVAGAAPRLTRGKLSELAWSLDVQKAQDAGGELES